MKRERILYILLWSVALSVVYRAFVPPVAKYNKNIERDRFWNYKVQTTEKYDLVAVGDSRIYRGISPCVMQDKLSGWKIFNFGFSGARLDSLLIEKAIEKLSFYGKRVLVIGISPGVFSEGSNEHYEEIVRKGKNSVLSSFYFFEILYYFHRISLDDAISLINGENLFFDNSNYVENYNWKTGFVGSFYREENGLERTLRSYRKAVRVAFSFQRVSAFIRNLNTFRKSGGHVFLVKIPISSELEKIEVTWKNYNSDNFFKMFEKSGFPVITKFESIHFHSYDGSHLHKNSARLLSRKLADIIADKFKIMVL